ncbi:MAG: type II toxin-antitoxin system PrlF family antitoxin [Rhodobacteraceae bacterium]|nr:type II toxin-antitoxin system PrlF family antitoxin [Paracoccaceae bacterium]
MPNGQIYIEPLHHQDDDPALVAFLAFLETDIRSHPEQICAFAGALHQRLKALVGDVPVDLDKPLSPKDE